QMTWCARPSAASFWPSTSPSRPPTLASISSKTSVPGRSWPARTVLSASIVRDSSPPEATLRSGRAGSPGLAASSSSSWSAPQAGQAGRGRAVARGDGRQRNVEAGVAHAQVGELALGLGGELLGHLLPRLAQLGRRRFQPAERLRQLALDAAEVLLLPL